MNKRLAKEKTGFNSRVALRRDSNQRDLPDLPDSTAAVLRVIRETGEAFADYMDKELRDLPCARIEMDEQWQYVGCHAGRMKKPEHVYERGDQTRGDFWLWACIDADTKLAFSHASESAIGRMVGISSAMFGSAFAGRCKSRPITTWDTRVLFASILDMRDSGTELKQRYSASR